MLKKKKNINVEIFIMRLALLLIIFPSNSIKATSQIFTTHEIVELYVINALKMYTSKSEITTNYKRNNWVVVKGSASLIEQEGNKNYALIKQIGGVGNIAKVLQQGHSNLVVHEHDEMTKHGIYQLGNRNYSDVKQFGDQNISVTFQFGCYNEINIIQQEVVFFSIGLKPGINSSNVLQNGYDNSATIIQASY